MIPRVMSEKLLESFNKYPILTITGPRQSGKRTLIRACFPELAYVNLEDLQFHEYARSDPIDFIESYPEGAIFDEIQRVPELFSAIQVRVDDARKNGMYILSGSQNFLLLEKISQSLAGRTAIFNLLPLSYGEITTLNRNLSLEELLFHGGYPRIYHHKLNPTLWLESYIQAYVERDVRSIKAIHDLGTFQTFVKMCAARSGQLLDLSSLGNDCGVSHNTIRAWIGILEASFIVYLLRPHYKNFNKRLIKSPKLYFYDSGLLCALLGIRSAQELRHHSMRGAIFETFVIGEMKKYFLNNGYRDPLYFWRDKRCEIDCIVERSVDRLVPIEIKSAKTLQPDFFSGLNYWLGLSGCDQGILIYAGEQTQKRKQITVKNWRSTTEVLSKVFQDL